LAKVFSEVDRRATPAFRHYLNVLLANRPREYFESVLRDVIDAVRHQMALQARSFETIVRKTIKAMSPLTYVEKSDVITLLESRVNQGAVKLGSALSCFKTFVKHNDDLDVMRFHQFLSAFGICLRQRNPGPILAVFKLTSVLLTNKLLPPHVLADVLEHILSFPRFLDQPYNIITMQLFKRLGEAFDSAPESLVVAFQKFALDSLRFLRDIEKLWLLSHNCPLFVDRLPFSINHALIRCLSARKEKVTQLNQFGMDSFDHAISALVRPPNPPCPYSADEMSSLTKLGFDYLGYIFRNDRSVIGLRESSFTDFF
jgi:hypothetical protein